MKIMPENNFCSWIFTLVILSLTAVIALLPLDKYYKRDNSNRESRCVVVSTNNSCVFQHGIVREGEQGVRVKLLDGPDRGRSGRRMVRWLTPRLHSPP